MIRPALLLVLVLFALEAAAADSPADLYRKARKAEKRGALVEAYALYSQAALLDPSNHEYAGRSLALKTSALSQLKPASPQPSDPPGGDPAPVIHALITEEDLAEAARLKPPPAVKFRPGRQDYNLNLPVKPLFEQVARGCGVDIVVDTELERTLQPRPMRFETAQADCPEVFRMLEAVTGTFVSPLTDRLLLIVQDTPAKRTEQERSMALTVPVPEPFTLQEAQELARMVQQVMELQKFAVDGGRRLVFMRGPVSKVKHAAAIYEDLLARRAQVAIDVELYGLNEESSLSYGLQLPTRAQILNFGNIAGWVQRSPALFTKFLTFGGGASLFGLGVADAELVASMTYNSARSLYQAQVRTLDTTPAQLVVGDKYPILTQAFVGTTPGGSQSTGSGLAFPPTVQFTDLGLTLKVTPRIHSAEEVGLDVETEFKVLTGQSANSIPVIATRSYRGTVRLKQGEWAVVAGLVTDSDTRSLSGIPLVRDVPGLGSRGRDKRRGDTLLVIRPRVLTLPPSESLVTRGIGVGTEGRLRAPL